MALEISYEGKDYILDLEDMDTDQARAIERFGIPNLKALEDGIGLGDVGALHVCYWLCLVQNGEPGARLERVRMKPVKFARALTEAAMKLAEARRAEGEDDPKSEV